MDIKELEARVRILEDVEAIKQLHIRYVNCLTTCNWDELVDCFDENGAANLWIGKGKQVIRGRAELTKAFKENVARVHIGKEGNFVVHPLINVDGDKANGSRLLYIQYTTEPRTTPRREDLMDWVQGYYDMEYVKRDGKWKISFLDWKARLLSPRPTATGGQVK